MAKKKAKKRVYKRERVHSSIDRLPLWLYKAIAGMLKDNKWPADFRDHWDGAPRYIDAVRYCKSKGHTVSLSAIGRFAKRGKALPTGNIVSIPGTKQPEPIAQRIREYIRAHIAEACEHYKEMTDDYQGNKIHPSRNYEPVSVNKTIEVVADEQLKYISQAISDLQSLDSGGSSIRAGAG